MNTQQTLDPPPTSFRQLLRYLRSHPHVRRVGVTGPTIDLWFSHYVGGVMCWRSSISTVLFNVQSAFEPGLAFEPDGFVFSRAGLDIRFEYVPWGQESEFDFPTNLKQAIRYLNNHRRVRITRPTPQSREPMTQEAHFCSFKDGAMWFEPVEGEIYFIPIGWTLCEAAAKAETGLAFDRDGFTVIKFGGVIRVDYVP